MNPSLAQFALSSDDVERIDEYRRSHKVALLTMILTDIVGYSALCERLSDSAVMRVVGDFENLTSLHFETEKGGLIVKRIGDAALVIFAEPVSAVLAALDFHQALSTTSFSGVNLEARTGIHLGQVTVEQKGTQLDIFGRHVNRVARVQAEAKPGEILVTDPVEDNVRTCIGDENRVIFFGRRSLLLKGIENPIDVFTVDFLTDHEYPEGSVLPDAYIILEVKECNGSARSVVFDPAHDRRIIFGRAKEADIVLDDRRVSRKHGMIMYDNTSGWTLSDLGSSFGVSLNGIRPDKEVVLAAGDVIRAGESEIHVTDMKIYPIFPSVFLG